MRILVINHLKVNTLIYILLEISFGLLECKNEDFQYKNSLQITNKNLVLRYDGEERISLLAMDDETLLIKIKNDEIERLFHILQSEVLFINTIRTASTPRLSDIFDTINCVMKDFFNSINLIRRLKVFHTISSKLINCIEISSACDLLIKNSCDVLVCDRASIFVYDKMQDKLSLKSSIGLRNNITCGTNQGIVGWVFTNGQRQCIEDVYKDDRFNQAFDKITNYRTKSMLCVPLRDTAGLIFGVMQCINKNSGSFNYDDEEIIEIFAKQAGAILKNSISFDEINFNITRMKMVLNFAVDIQTLEDIEIFIEKSKKLINSLLNVSISQLVLITEKKKFKRYDVSTKDYILSELDLGIIGKAYKKKCFLFHRKEDKHKSFLNTYIDLEIRNVNMVTFPIFDQPMENSIIAIIQSEYKGRIIDEERNEDEDDRIILNELRKITGSWLTNYSLKNNL